MHFCFAGAQHHQNRVFYANIKHFSVREVDEGEFCIRVGVIPVGRWSPFLCTHLGGTEKVIEVSHPSRLIMRQL